MVAIGAVVSFFKDAESDGTGKNNASESYENDETSFCCAPGRFRVSLE